MSHSSEDCFGKCSYQKFIMDGLEGPLCSRADAVKQYNKSEQKWKKDMKALKKQNKIFIALPRSPAHSMN